MSSIFDMYIEEDTLEKIRQIEANNYMSNFNIDNNIVVDEDIDMDSGLGGKLKPVFILLMYSGSTFSRVAGKFVKGQTYWHAAIGFGPSLNKLYSFNVGKAGANKFFGGLSFESLEFYIDDHPDSTMEVSCILLSTVKYNKLRDTLDYYMQNKEKTRYSFINLAYSLFGKASKNGTKFNLVCSTFVDTILKSINVDVSGQKYSNLVKPDDLRASEGKEKQFKVYEGRIADYNPLKVAKKVESMYDNKSLSYFAK